MFLEVFFFFFLLAAISFTYQQLSFMQSHCVQIAELSSVFIVSPLANGCHGNAFADHDLCRLTVRWPSKLKWQSSVGNWWMNNNSSNPLHRKCSSGLSKVPRKAPETDGYLYMQVCHLENGCEEWKEIKGWQGQLSLFHTTEKLQHIFFGQRTIMSGVAKIKDKSCLREFCYELPEKFIWYFMMLFYGILIGRKHVKMWHTCLQWSSKSKIHKLGMHNESLKWIISDNIKDIIVKRHRNFRIRIIVMN